MTTSIAILGTAGIPAKYGGFETLAENLVRFHASEELPGRVMVYCTTKGSDSRLRSYLGASLHYIPINANGPLSVLYDAVSLASIAFKKVDAVLLLGVSGAFALPLIRAFTSCRIVTNVDGIEWKREKWRGFARWWLRKSEAWAVAFSHEVISDNQAIATHIKESYGRNSHVIAYGGDHALDTASMPYEGSPLPKRYALAICRIEPENNVAAILEAFATSDKRDLPLVFVGNWSHSKFAQEMRQAYGGHPNLRLLDPIYDTGVLRGLREGAAVYVHGHSAGGTNPSLVEIMHFGVPVVAFDCVFNRHTTADRALFFTGPRDLRKIIRELKPAVEREVGKALRQIARQRYTWRHIGSRYFELLNAASHVEIGAATSGGSGKTLGS